MKCINPRRIPNKSDSARIENAFIQVSCGKCYACLANRRRSWLFRLMNEHENSLKSLFVTFTYSDDYYPSDGLLNKKHLQNFFKRLRHHDVFTYYAIGEYGTHTYRAHYHAVIFFKSLNFPFILQDYIDLISSQWKYGFVYVSSVSYRRLNYVLHYHTRPKIVNGKPTFQLFSKGMGVDFLDDNMVQYLVNTKSSTIRDYNGNVYVIPRYYRKKLIEKGYNIDNPNIVYNSDNWKDRVEKHFKMPIYRIPSSAIADYMYQCMDIDYNKMNSYNKQDKYI